MNFFAPRPSPSPSVSRPTINDILALRPDVLRWARRRGLCLDAEDLAQEALFKATLEFHTFDPARGSLKGWLYTVTLRSCSLYQRRDQRDALKKAFDRDVTDVIPFLGPPPDHEVMCRLMFATTLHAL